MAAPLHQADDRPEPLMTAEDVAAFLRVSLSTVYQLRRTGKLPGIPVGSLWRWSPDLVRAFGRGEVLPQQAAPSAPQLQVRTTGRPWRPGGRGTGRGISRRPGRRRR